MEEEPVPTENEDGRVEIQEPLVPTSPFREPLEEIPLTQPSPQKGLVEGEEVAFETAKDVPPNSGDVPPEQEKTQKEENGVEIPDVDLTRHQQDAALGKRPGKGRKPKAPKEQEAKPKGHKKGKGRGKGKSPAKGRGGAKGKGRSKGKGGKARKALDFEDSKNDEQLSLIRQEPELWTDSGDEKGEPVKPKAKAAPKRHSKAKAVAESEDSRVPKRARSDQVKPADGEGSNPKKTRKDEEKVDKVKPAPKTRSKKQKDQGKANEEEEKPEKKSRKGKTQDPEEQTKRKSKATAKDEQGKEEDQSKKQRRNGVMHTIPRFQHSTIVPYWSRGAVALKVKTGLGVSGLTQARLSKKILFQNLKGLKHAYKNHLLQTTAQWIRI